jgi:actin-related protein
MGYKELYIGDEAQSMRGMLTLQHPVQHGIIRNFDDWESIFHHMVYNELRVRPEEHPFLIAEPYFNPTSNREKMCQLLFETFNVPATHFDPSPVLALYSFGLTVGTVLDIGDGVCQSVPIYEGVVMPHAVQRLNLGGSDLNQYLARLLKQRGICFNTTAEMEQVRCMKEKLCYVASNFEEYMQMSATSSSMDKGFQCSDEQVITIGNELFRCPEALFQPAAIGFVDRSCDFLWCSPKTLRFAFFF